LALKVLPAKRAREEDRTLARFLREMDLCQRVSHPHLTKTFEAGDVGGVHYIAMEYIRGDSLRRAVADRGPLNVPRAARLFAEVADGLEHAHEQGLVHRDLKPSNIMVTPNGHAKILDLGLALAVDEELPSDKKIVGGQGYVVGTMDYIAPEQVDDASQVDARADLYSLGCSLYFALTGQPPFPGGTSIEKMKRHRTEYPNPISDFNPTVPANFIRVVERLMDKSPGRRYQTAAAVRDALRPWAAGEPDTPMDVDPDQTEAQAVLELERTQPDPGSFFETVPVVVFADRMKRDSPDSDTDEVNVNVDGTSKKRFPLWLLLIPVGLFVMCLGAALTGLVLYLAKA
jgi:serine/threonine protein kinase